MKKDGELLPTVTEVSINREGVLSWRASNGKFYCRQPVVSCDCCDNICGPNQGCNCTACQELEKTEREKGNVNQMCLPFLHPPCCWSWGSNLEKTDLHDYLQTLQVYQQVTLFKTTESVKSLERLNKRMTVLGRYLASLSRECFDKENKDNKEVKTKTHSHSEESKKKKEVYVKVLIFLT